MFDTPRDLGHSGVVRSLIAPIRPRSRGLAAMVCGVALLAAMGGCSTPNSNAGEAPGPSISASPSEVTVTLSPTPFASTLGDLTGAWKGSWTNTSPQTAVGTFVLTWAQQGSLLFGAIGVSGSNCIDAGNVSGQVDGSKISFGAVEGDTSIFYEGVVSGTIMTGTYRSDCGNSTGTWTAVKA
jgi:hypothetical protein